VILSTASNQPGLTGAAADNSRSSELPHSNPKAPRWYSGKRNAVGIAVLSLFIYLWVLITALGGATLRGNEAVYVTGWTCLVFYVLWKRRGWQSWLGALVGLISGLAIVILASLLAGWGINR
jgi:hypothetical protein